MEQPNILINEDGEPRISDFGLARLFDSNGSSLGQTSFKGQGSVWWQAPELLYPTKFNGIEPGLTTKSDVYAFACVSFEVSDHASLNTPRHNVCLDIYRENSLFGAN